MSKLVHPSKGVVRRGRQSVRHVGEPNNDRCPRHGSGYVIRRGTNQCPKGRKNKEICR